MNPDKVSIVDFTSDGFGKESVCCSIGRPRGLVKGDFARVVMEERP